LPRSCPRHRFGHVVELDWETPCTFGDVKITAFQPVHWGDRYFWERKRRGYNSYLLEKNGKSVFFCGDSAYGEFFSSIARS